MSEWKRKTLGDLEIVSGGTIQTGPFGSQLHMSDYSAEGVPVVMPTNIAGMRIDPSGIARVDVSHVERLAKHRLRKGDIVYSRRGDVEKCALVTDTEEGWLCGTGCINVRVQGPQVDPVFLSYALSMPKVQEWIRRHSVGATMANLNTSILREVAVPIPSMRTQRAIAEVLGALDDKIAANRRVIDASEELQLALFRRISRTGEHLRLGEMIRLMYGKALPQDMRVPGEVAVVGSGGVVGSHTEGLVSGPAVVVGRKGSVGTVHWIDRDAYPIDTTFWVEPIDELPLPYLHRLLESLPLNSMSSDSAVPGLNREHAYSLLLPAHDREDINRFARDVEGLIARSSLAERENQVLASTRDELLPLLMSGRITVGAASSHVEEVV